MRIFQEIQEKRRILWPIMQRATVKRPSSIYQCGYPIHRWTDDLGKSPADVVPTRFPLKK